MTSRQTILFPSGAPRQQENLEEYRRRGGYEALRLALARAPSAVTEEVAASGLRGRGGAAFPTAQKMSLCAQAGGPSGTKDKYVVVNGGEDEPGSFKDRALLEYTPHA